jgi:hypothetical protein
MLDRIEIQGFLSRRFQTKIECYGVTGQGSLLHAE